MAIDTVRAVPTIPSRPLRGPSKNGGFLLGTHKPHPPGALPSLFALPVREADLAMAPVLSLGEEAIFSTSAVPTAGDCILVGTIFGPEIRQLEPDGEGWAGCSLNPEYEHIRTADEEAWIMAVLVGVRDLPTNSVQEVAHG